MSAFCWKITFSVIGIIVGLSAGAVFGLKFQNPDSASFGLCSAVFAALTLVVHVLHRRVYWTYPSHSSLIRLMYTGCFVQLLGVVGFVVYLVFGCLKEGNRITIQGRGFYLTCVWCFMTWKWGFLLFYFCRKYLRDIRKADGITIAEAK